jgi:hypothetical protein
VNTVMNVAVLENAGISWIAEELLASHDGLWCTQSAD